MSLHQASSSPTIVLMMLARRSSLKRRGHGSKIPLSGGFELAPIDNFRANSALVKPGFRLRFKPAADGGNRAELEADGRRGCSSQVNALCVALNAVCAIGPS